MKIQFLTFFLYFGPTHATPLTKFGPICFSIIFTPSSIQLVILKPRTLRKRFLMCKLSENRLWSSTWTCWPSGEEIVIHGCFQPIDENIVVRRPGDALFRVLLHRILLRNNRERRRSWKTLLSQQPGVFPRRKQIRKHLCYIHHRWYNPMSSRTNNAYPSGIRDIGTNPTSSITAPEVPNSP